MSTLPSQLFAQNLQSGMDHYIQQQNLLRSRDALELQEDALELQRQGEARRAQSEILDENFRRDQLNETTRYHNILDQQRSDALDYQRQIAEARALQQAEESRAAAFDFSDLMGREQAARFTLTDQVGPPQPAGPVGMDDPRVQNFESLNSVAQRAIRDRKLREVEKLELEVSGKSRVRDIMRQRDAAQELLSRTSPDDRLNYSTVAARLFRLNQALDEVNIGIDKPSTGTPDGFNRFLDLQMPKPDTSPNRPNASLANELSQMELERAMIAEALDKKTEPSWFRSGGEPANQTIMVGPGGKMEVSRAIAEQRLKVLDQTIDYMKRGMNTFPPSNIPAGPGPAVPPAQSPVPAQKPLPNPQQKEQIFSLMDRGMSYDQAYASIFGR